MKQEIIKLSNKWIEELWQKRNIDAVDYLHSNNFIDHSPAGRNNNNDGFKTGIKELFFSFPDFYTIVEEHLIDEEKNTITIRWSAKGTHENHFMNFAPTNKIIQFKGIEILKIHENKITERWGEWDGLSLVEQFVQSSIEKVFQKKQN